MHLGSFNSFRINAAITVHQTCLHAVLNAKRSLLIQQVEYRLVCMSVLNTIVKWLVSTCEEDSNCSNTPVTKKKKILQLGYGTFGYSFLGLGLTFHSLGGICGKCMCTYCALLLFQVRILPQNCMIILHVLLDCGPFHFSLSVDIYSWFVVSNWIYRFFRCHPYVIVIPGPALCLRCKQWWQWICLQLNPKMYVMCNPDTADSLFAYNFLSTRQRTRK
jgi:hypothetical protein